MSAGHCPPWCGGTPAQGFCMCHPPNLAARPPTSGCFAAVVVPPHSISRHPTPDPSDCPKLQPVASNQQQTKRSSLTTREGFQQATTLYPCPPSPARWASLPAPPHTITPDTQTLAAAPTGPAHKTVTCPQGLSLGLPRDQGASAQLSLPEPPLPGLGHAP